MATLLTILWLPFELMWYLFGSHGYISAKAVPAVISSSLSCSSTEAEDDTSTQTETEGSLALSEEIPCSDVVLEQVSQALRNPSRTLVLTDLVEQVRDSRDALALGDLLQDQQRWHSVCLRETVCASN